MSEMAARYDLRARSYGRCWAPVLAPSALALLDAVEPAIANATAGRLLDAGTGSGTLAIAAVRRWPLVRVTGLDVSAGMLALARAAADLTLDAKGLARLSLLEGSVADPESAGLEPASIDAAVSSFVLHLVAERAPALAGLRRVLRPGGVLAFVVWAAEGKPWAIEAAFDAALAETLAQRGISAPTPAAGATRAGPIGSAGATRAGPIGSADAARAELVEAGFANVEAWEPVLHHPFGRAAARALFVEYDRAADLEALSPVAQTAVLAAFDAALDGLPDAAFTWDAPLVAARAVRPHDA
jgi:SAM-dependent methyltransferase